MHTRQTLDRVLRAENEALLRHLRLGELILVELGPIAINETDPGYEKAQGVSAGRFDGVLLEHGRNLPHGLRLLWSMSLKSDNEGAWRHHHSFSLQAKSDSLQATIRLQRNASHTDDGQPANPWTLELKSAGGQAPFAANLDRLMAAVPAEANGLDDREALLAKLRSLTDFSSFVHLTGFEAAACIMAALAICKNPYTPP